jgi:hypothetical protein
MIRRSDNSLYPHRDWFLLELPCARRQYYEQGFALGLDGSLLSFLQDCSMVYVHPSFREHDDRCLVQIDYFHGCRLNSQFQTADEEESDMRDCDVISAQVGIIAHRVRTIQRRFRLQKLRKKLECIMRRVGRNWPLDTASTCRIIAFVPI